MTDSDAILKIEPPVLKFQMWHRGVRCSMHLSNLTDVHVAFKVHARIPKDYRVRPCNGILLPRATCDVVVAMERLVEARLEKKRKHNFIVLSVIVDPGNESKEVTEEMFSKESGYSVRGEKLSVIDWKTSSTLSPVREGLDERPSQTASVSDNEGSITSEFGNESIVTSQYEKNSSEGTVMVSQQSSQDDHPQQEEDLQRINAHLTSIFDYEELQEATKYFNPSEVVGEGGFGIVYRGKLGDGRTVAVKDLNVQHPKWIEQFVNEVAVLSRVRHQNLVSLYGCTNQESGKLLIVYELVPNGTVADHLYGRQVWKASLSWDTRIRIAVETADAISYLHSLKPPIIHRDIKTDNILLDKNFTVKVADLGNCRRLTLGTVHVLTMPQGTQGYVDPEYDRCFKLTDKSDVYSFGVVLLELISGKKALDLDRDAGEIWLSRMALKKMEDKAIEQLVDPGLGYCSDEKMMWMVNSVTELALRCLRPEGNMRPPMIEVLMTLKKIRDGDIMAHDDTSSSPLACKTDSLSASDLPETDYIVEI